MTKNDIITELYELMQLNSIEYLHHEIDWLVGLIPAEESELVSELLSLLELSSMSAIQTKLQNIIQRHGG